LWQAAAKAKPAPSSIATMGKASLNGAVPNIMGRLDKRRLPHHTDYIVIGQCAAP
jgi:hypothetical protein